MPFLHHFGFGGMWTGFGGGSFKPTSCWTDGTTTNVLKPLPDGGFGYDDAQTPSNGIYPSATSELQHIYSLRFYVTGHADEGLWILQLGVAGDEISLGSTKGVLSFGVSNAENVLMVWNETNLRYEGHDTGTADVVASHVDEEVCFALYAVPRVLIFYDFETLEVKGMEDYVPPSDRLVRIQYTSTDDLTLLTPYAVGGTAHITDNGDGTYDLWSDDACEFITLDEDSENFTNLNITKIEVIEGSTLKYFYLDGTTYDSYTFCNNNVSEIIIADTSNVTSMDSMFIDCISLVSLNVTSFDTSKVTNMNSMFNGCSSLPSLDVTSFDTSKVTNMYGMFGRCYLFTSLDLTSFDTSNVTSMVGMFYEDNSLLCITNLDTTNVTEKTHMFSGCTSLVQPDATAQADLTDDDGADWVNPNACP